MRIQISSVSDIMTGTSSKGKTFQKVDVEYFAGGKKYNKTLTQYSDAFKALKDALPDQMFTLDLEKNGNFTEWKNVQPLEDDVAPAPETVEKSKQKSASKASYGVRKASSVSDPRETAEERLVRNERISRMAAINSAIAFIGTQRVPEGVYGGAGVEGVLSVAQQFLDFVNNTPKMEVEDGDQAE